MESSRRHGWLVSLALVPALAAGQAPAAAAPAPARAPFARSLNQPGAASLGAKCALRENADKAACEQVRKLCSEAVYRGNATAACGDEGLETPRAVALVDSGEPRKIPNPRALPVEVDDALAACERDAQCLTLADLRSGYPKPYDALGEWCLTRELAKDFGGFDARGQRTSKVVCEAIKAGGVSDPKPLQEVRMATVYLLQAAASVERLSCSGFGLTVPLVRIRHPTKDETDVSGPVASGIGGGYYLAASCAEEWSWGFDFIAYSEGIDLTKQEAHFAVGVGAGVAAYKYFRFGLAIGYDLYRQDLDANDVVVSNGLLAGKDLGRPSFSYLVTLSFQGRTPEKKTEPAAEE